MTTHPLPDAALSLALPDDADSSAAVSRAHLERLLNRVAEYLRGSERNLARRYERVVAADDGDVHLTDEAFWARVGDALRYDDAETAAVRRAHEATLLLAGDQQGRRAEFESALDIRSAVVLDR
ncbi:hypothetical protein [Halarchaeum sp. P4]|uniref:hypothetical protein n=1 Tax=Halarchaeum sp. P4 TaxID=3421639 RepID=UPI003EBD915C